jgi:hypothetical protein
MSLPCYTAGTNKRTPEDLVEPLCGTAVPIGVVAALVIACEHVVARSP